MAASDGFVNVHFNFIFQMFNTILAIGLLVAFVYVLYLGIRTLKLAYLYLEYRCEELGLIKKRQQKEKRENKK